MGSTKQIRTGVIGAGYMGSLHCKAYSQIESCEFAGIYDPIDKTAKDLSAKYNVVRFNSITELLDGVDAVSIAAPTTLHFMIAKESIKKGINILMEKPIAAGIEEAANMIKMLEGRGLVFAMGYIERFNPAVLKSFELLKGRKIKSFEAERLAPPAARANDVSVIFDLMIHDIDILLAMTGYQNPVSIKARGQKISGDVVNDASCDLVFGSGLVAGLVASKISDKKSRTVKVVCDDCTVQADLISKKVVFSSGGADQVFEARGEEPIKAEVLDFISSVQDRRAPKVGAKEAYLSFETADKIEKAISIV